MIRTAYRKKSNMEYLLVDPKTTFEDVKKFFEFECPVQQVGTDITVMNRKVVVGDYLVRGPDSYVNLLKKDQFTHLFLKKPEPSFELNEEQINKNWEEVKAELLAIDRDGIDELVDYLQKSDYWVAPASTRYHQDYLGGLVQHNRQVKQHAQLLNTVLGYDIPEDSITLICHLHDLCKVNYYSSSKRNVKENGTWKEVDYFTVDDKFPIGHAQKSVIVAQQFIKLTSLEIACITGHMGGFVSDNYFHVNKLYDKFPEAQLFHFADMLGCH